MTDETPTPETNRAPIPGVQLTVPIEDFEYANINAALSGFKSVSCYAISQRLTELKNQALSNEDQRLATVLNFIEMLTTFHFESGSKGEPFKAHIMMEGRRTLIPSDILPEQNNIIAIVAPSLQNAGLRARL